MNTRFSRCGYLFVFVAVLATGCGSSNPAGPSGASAPQPLTPANNSQVQYGSQPVTLTVQNAVSTTGGATYTFEVATDGNFTNKVQTKDGVAEGSGGQTTVKLDMLDAQKDYFWHAKATVAGKSGTFGSVSKFTVGVGVILNAPVPIAPLQGAETGLRPALRVTNATHSGPAGAITYKFELARDSAFTSMIDSGTQPEGINETGFIPSSDVPSATPLYWRATALDAANSVSSPPTGVESFTATVSQAEKVAAQLGVVLWPGQQPTGAHGHATMGDNWQVQIAHHIPTNTFFQCPTPEYLRFFDLFDRGLDPQSAIDWMNSHGYPTQAFWYPPPEKAVLGFSLVYLAARDKIVVNGTWNLVVKLE